MFELSLLGGAVAEDASGVSTDLAARRYAVALLALLATAPSRRLSRGKLIGLLWPEAHEAKGRNRLNTYVHRIRSELGRGTLRSIGDDVRLEPDHISCDVWRFQEALDRGDREAAVALYRGPFLDGFSLPGSPEFERRMDVVGDRLTRAYREALEELADEAERLGDLDAAARWWHARHDDDPLDARVARRLMRALAAVGNHAASLRVGEEHIERVRRELGARPDPGIVAFLEELKRPSREAGRPAAGAREDPGAPRAARVEPASARTASPASARTPAPSSVVDGRRVAVSGSAGGPPRRLRALLPVLAGLATAGTLGGWALVGREWPGARDAERAPGSPASVATHSTAAYDLYLRARELDRSGAQARSRGGKIELYRRALEIDPGFAAAWAGIADAYIERAWSGEGLEPWSDSAAAAARRALELDPVLADAHAQLGDVYWTLGRRDEARASYVRALEIDPTHWEAMNNLLVMLARRGELADRVGWLDRYRRLLPESPVPIAGLVEANADLERDNIARAWLELGRDRGHDLRWTELHLALFRWQDLDRAEELVEELGAVEPATIPSYRMTRRRAALALYRGDLRAARRSYQALYPGEPRAFAPIFKGLLWDPLGLAHTLARSGGAERAREIAREVIANTEREMAADPDHLPLHRMAVAHLLLGDESAALDWLEASVERGYRNRSVFLTVPTLEGLRGHPRFRALLARIDAAVGEERARVEAEGWGLPEQVDGAAPADTALAGVRD